MLTIKGFDILATIETDKITDFAICVQFANISFGLSRSVLISPSSLVNFFTPEHIEKSEIGSFAKKMMDDNVALIYVVYIGDDTWDDVERQVTANMMYQIQQAKFAMNMAYSEGQFDEES